MRKPVRRTMMVALAAVCIAAVGAVWFRWEAGNRYTVVVTTDTADAIYSVHDVVRFNVTVLRAGKPVPSGSVRYVLSNDGQLLEEGEVRIGGQTNIPGHLDNPGFLRCLVTYSPADGEPVSGLAAAAVSPLQIDCESSSPDDFDEFWAAKKQRLNAIPLNPVLTEVQAFQKDVEAFDLKLDCIGPPVSGFFARPKHAASRTLPAILRVHGAGVGSALRSQAIRGAKLGMLSADINAHGIPNGRPNSYYQRLADVDLKRYPHQGKYDRETCYFLGMYLRVLRAIDFLTAQSEWDGRVLIVHGSSQGGAQAIAAAGLDERVSMIGAGVPALCNQQGPIRGWPQLIEMRDGKPERRSLQTSGYFDVVNFASRTKAEAIFSVGFLDTTCPPTSVYMAYNELTGKKRIINAPLMGHSAPLEIQQAFMRAFTDHIDASR